MPNLPGDFSSINVRGASILTSGYVAGTVVDLQLKNQVQVLVAFTLGSLTSMDLKFEYSLDKTTWYQETFDSVSSGTNTESLGIRHFTATGNYQISVPILGKYFRISAIGNGTVTSSSLQLDVIYGVV